MATDLMSDTAVLVTQSEVLAAGMSALLLSVHPIERVRRHTDIDSLLESIAGDQPAILIIDSSISGKGTSELMRSLRAVCPDSRRVLMSDDMQEVRQLAADGLELVVIKGADPGWLAQVFENMLVDGVAV